MTTRPPRCTEEHTTMTTFETLPPPTGTRGTPRARAMAVLAAYTPAGGERA
jgi:hypothetical protein